VYRGDVGARGHACEDKLCRYETLDQRKGHTNAVLAEVVFYSHSTPLPERDNEAWYKLIYLKKRSDTKRWYRARGEIFRGKSDKLQ